MSPDSPFWSFEAWSSVGASNLLAGIDRTFGDDNEVVYAYVEEGLAAHPDPDVRAQFLDWGTIMPDYQGFEDRKWRYYAQIQAEYSDTDQAEQMRRRFAPERKLQAGNTVPDFFFSPLNDSAVVFTNHALRGRSYRVDFWGTWCGPCIDELPDLHEAHEAYRERGFDILSVAMMDEKEAIQEFREERFVMPWMHTLVERADDEAIRTAFEITGFPRPILVDEEGIIIAIDDSLRDGKVSDAVAALFDAKD